MSRTDTGESRPFPIALLGIAQICSWGTLFYSFPQIAEAIINDLGWLKSEVYGALTISLLFSSMAAIPVGSLIDWGKGRVVMVVGSLLAGLLLMLASTVDTLFWLYVVYAGIGFLHAATLYEAAFSVIVQSVEHSKARDHIVTLTLWGGFASTLFIPLIELVLSYTDWRTTLIILGLVNVFVCAGIYMFLPANKTPQVQEAPATEKPRQQHTVLWAIQQPVFWALLLCFAFFAAAATTFKFHLYPLLIEKGFSAQEVVLLLALLGPAQVLGRIAIKAIGSKAPALTLGLIMTSVLPIVFIAISVLPEGLWWFAPCLIAFGIASGTMTIVKGLAIPELLTRQAYGAINGAMNIPVKVFKALSPTIAASIWLVAQDYNLVLVVLTVIGVIAVICFSVVRELSQYSRGQGVESL